MNKNFIKQIEENAVRMSQEEGIITKTKFWLWSLWDELTSENQRLLRKDRKIMSKMSENDCSYGCGQFNDLVKHYKETHKREIK